MIRVEGKNVYVSTKTTDAVFTAGQLTSLIDKKGTVYVDSSGDGESVSAVYRFGETISMKNSRAGEIYVRRVSDSCAEIRYDAWDGNGVLTITEDKGTGDICVEPEVTSTRRGILAARYQLDGIAPDYRLVAPIYQGIDMELNEPLIKGRRWVWPKMWEAGLVILQNGSNGFWVHTEDSRYRCKALVTGCGKEGRGLAFDSEAYGPIDSSICAGGLVWRINVFEGDWKVPAMRYGEWLWKAYDLSAEEKKRSEWTKDIRMALSWCPTDAALLRELANRVEPQKILLHLPNWRKMKYDQGYPDFTPSDEFVKFMEYAAGLGFRCMPHANSIDMDPTMPEYSYVSDYKYRTIENGTLQGWGYEAGKVLGVPSSNKALAGNRARNVMIKVHPGLALWRALLAERIDAALEALGRRTDAVFIDVTLCSENIDNCLVDNTTPIEGMNRLIEHIQSIGDGLTVGGEGLNEITMQHLSFAQAHLFDSHSITSKGLEKCGGCDLNEVLFGKLCRTIGYSNLGGKNEEQIMRERIHEEHGAIPTITVGSAEEISSPNAEVERILKLAAE